MAFKKCPRCEHELPNKGRRFCPNCGLDLADASRKLEPFVSDHAQTDNGAGQIKQTNPQEYTFWKDVCFFIGYTGLAFAIEFFLPILGNSGFFISLIRFRILLSAIHRAGGRGRKGLRTALIIYTMLDGLFTACAAALYIGFVIGPITNQ